MNMIGMSMVIALMSSFLAVAQTNESASTSSNGVTLTPAVITAYTKATVAIQEAPSSIEEASFDFESPAVNRAVIGAYSSDPTVWSNRNLFIVGACCVKEHRYVEAKSIFFRLKNEIPGDMRAERAYANAAFLNGDYDDARNVFRSLWTNKRDVASLKGLGRLAIQEKDITALRELVPTLIEHRTDDIDVRKMLLLYSLMEEDTEKGGPVVAAAVWGLKKSEVEGNADLRKVLILATMKYKDIAEPNESNRTADVVVSWPERRRAMALVDAGKYAEGLRMADDRIASHPDDAYAYYVRGRARYFMREWDKAIESLQKAQDMSPFWQDWEAKYTGPLIRKAKTERDSERMPNRVLEGIGTNAPNLQH